MVTGDEAMTPGESGWSFAAEGCGMVIVGQFIGMPMQTPAAGMKTSGASARSIGQTGDRQPRSFDR